MFLTKLIFRKGLAIGKASRVLQRMSAYNCNVTAAPLRYYATKPETEKETEEPVKEEKEAKKEENTQEKAEKATEKHDDKKKKEQSSDSSDGENSVDSDEEFVLKAGEIKKLLKEQDEEIEALKKKLDNAINQYKYQLAENDNTVKRYKKELNQAKEFAISKFAKDMLEVRDNLQMAIDYSKKFDREHVESIEQYSIEYDNLHKGVDMTNTVFDKIMDRHNVVEYKPLGEKFDPNLHEAVTMVPNPNMEPNHICEVMRSGWKIGDRILRAAQVFVVRK